MEKKLCTRCKEKETHWVSNCQDCNKGFCHDCYTKRNELQQQLYQDHFKNCKVCKKDFNNICDNCKSDIIKNMDEDKYVGDPNIYIQNEMPFMVCDCEWHNLGYDSSKCVDETIIEAYIQYEPCEKLYLTTCAGYEAMYCRQCFIINKEREPNENLPSWR